MERQRESSSEVCWNSPFLFLHSLYLTIRKRINSGFAHLLYFLFLSVIGFGFLRTLKSRNPTGDLNLFFTAVSAATVSSMSVVNMEDISNSQLAVMTALMFLGGEVFTSMVNLYLSKSKSIKTRKSQAKVSAANLTDQIELTIVNVSEKPGSDLFDKNNPILRQDSIKFLVYVILGYFLMVQVLGVAAVSIYMAAIPSAMNILKTKGIKSFTFSIFVIVSTFTNCGFIPTNENMMVFSNNSGLLLILIPQILLGNTLFPPCLRFLVWLLGKKVKKQEAEYLLNDEIKPVYSSLLSKLHSQLLMATVFTFILIGTILFCALDWNSSAVSGLSPYRKFIGIVFQTMNARHSGENVFNLANLAPALIVFYIVMMYLPPSTTYLPIGVSSIEGEKKLPKDDGKKGKNLMFSHISYLAIFVVVLSITERKSIKEDPINFSLLNILVEVVSSYGNVGFTTGYTCELRLTPDPTCVSPWYGLSGRFSARGKFVIIVAMFFGRLKRKYMNGGQAWDLM